VIQHSMITKSIERAQKKVEENNFGIRKRLLEYDDVMNAQREVIYKKRHHALYGERLAIDISNLMYDVSESILNEYQENRDYEGFQIEILRALALECPFSEKEFLEEKPSDLTEKLYDYITNGYKAKTVFIADRVYPIIKDMYESHSNKYENVAIPITDGVKTLQILANIKRVYETKGKEVPLSIEKGLTLAIIDDAWKEHLREMDDLKQSVQNATYEQKDPLLIYKFESFELFRLMVMKINKDITSFLLKGKIPLQNSDDVQEADAPKKTDMSNLKTGRSDVTSPNRQQQPEQQRATQPVRVEKKVGRNDPCPCGSGKKYKQCHGKDA
jgi:preprotein translocase subunit SecA